MPCLSIRGYLIIEGSYPRHNVVLSIDKSDLGAQGLGSIGEVTNDKDPLELGVPGTIFSDH